MELSSSLLKTRTILIIDDDEADRLVYRRFLGKPHHYSQEFIEEKSGEEALLKYDPNLVDCILLDMHLPDMTGIDFLRKFKKKYEENSVPIVMLTGQGNEEDAVKALHEGAHDYLSKIRLTPENLNRAVDNAYEKVSLHKKLNKQNLDLEVKNHQLQVMKAHLERLIEERTHDLIVTNERLLVEIEERRKADSKVDDVAKFNRTVMDAAPFFIAYVDHNDCYRFANNQYEYTFNCRERDILGKTITEHLGNAFISQRRKALYGEIQKFEHHFINLQREKTILDITLTPRSSSKNEIQGYFIFGMDITEKTESENDLRQQSQLIDQSLNAIISTDSEGYIDVWNEGAERIFRYPKYQVENQHISFLFPDNDGEYFNKNIWLPLQEREQMESELVLKNELGEEVSINALFSLLHNIDGNTVGMVGYYLDNSETKQAEQTLEETEAKFAALFRDAATGIAIADLDGTIADYNSAFQNILGYDREEIINKAIEDYYVPDQKDEEQEFLGECKRGERTSYQLDKQLLAKDGHTIWGRLTTSIILGADQKPHFIVRMLEDITQQKESDALIRKSLDEKQVLLREVHHRVKNNLQVIQSLLRMQGRDAKGSAIEPLLRESQNRIRSIALIHEQLYKQDDFAEINFSNYLNLLLRQLFRTFSMGDVRISSTIEFKDISLSLTKSIPCALMVNELVTNSLKYAFKDRKEGKITIGAHKGEENMLTLIVKDDGVGLPENIDIEATETLGLKIVRTLIRQIGGEMDYLNNNGAEFRFTFDPGPGFNDFS